MLRADFHRGYAQSYQPRQPKAHKMHAMNLIHKHYLSKPITNTYPHHRNLPVIHDELGASQRHGLAPSSLMRDNKIAYDPYRSSSLLVI